MRESVKESTTRSRLRSAGPWLLAPATDEVPRGRAVDGVRAGLPIRRTLGLVWGVLTVLVGAYSILGSLGDPLATRGPGLGSSDLSISLGAYNLIGGLVLVVAGALLLFASRDNPRKVAQAAAVLSAVAGCLGWAPHRDTRVNYPSSR